MNNTSEREALVKAHFMFVYVKHKKTLQPNVKRKEHLNKLGHKNKSS